MPAILQREAPFRLNVGDMIQVTSELCEILVRSKNRDRFSATPLVARLIQDGERFVLPLVKSGQGKRFAVFVPKRLIPGDLLRIVWRDPTCACAELVQTVG